jgi:hypothetical protein
MVPEMPVPDVEEMLAVIEELKEPPWWYLHHGYWYGDSVVEQEVFIRQAVEFYRLHKRLPEVVPPDGIPWTAVEVQAIKFRAAEADAADAAHAKQCTNGAIE